MNQIRRKNTGVKNHETQKGHARRLDRRPREDERVQCRANERSIGNQTEHDVQTNQASGNDDDQRAAERRQGDRLHDRGAREDDQRCIEEGRDEHSLSG